MFYGIRGKCCCKLHDFDCVAVEVVGPVPQQTQGLNLGDPC